MWADMDFDFDDVDEDLWTVCAAPVPRVIIDPPCPVKIRVKKVRGLVKAPTAPAYNDEEKNSPTRPRPRHPPMASMIKEAILSLHERGGSSLQAIKKFISDMYHLDTDKLGRFIRKYLRDAVDNGILLHPKGKGATGHFKLTKKGKTAMGHSTSTETGHVSGTQRPRSSKSIKFTKKTISGGPPKVKKPMVKSVASLKPMRMYGSDGPKPAVPIH